MKLPVSTSVLVLFCKTVNDVGWDSKHIFARKLSSHGFHLLELSGQSVYKHTEPQNPRIEAIKAVIGGLFFTPLTVKALPRFPVVAVIGLPRLAVNIAQSTLRAVFLASGIQCLTRSGKLWLKSVSLPNDRAILFQGFPELFNDCSSVLWKVCTLVVWRVYRKWSVLILLTSDWRRALSCFTCAVRGNRSLKSIP